MPHVVAVDFTADVQSALYKTRLEPARLRWSCVRPELRTLSWKVRLDKCIIDFSSSEHYLVTFCEVGSATKEGTVRYTATTPMFAVRRRYLFPVAKQAMLGDFLGIRDTRGTNKFALKRAIRL